MTLPGRLFIRQSTSSEIVHIESSLVLPSQRLHSTLLAGSPSTQSSPVPTTVTDLAGAVRTIDTDVLTRLLSLAIIRPTARSQRCSPIDRSIASSPADRGDLAGQFQRSMLETTNPAVGIGVGGAMTFCINFLCPLHTVTNKRITIDCRSNNSRPTTLPQPITLLGHADRSITTLIDQSDFRSGQLSSQQPCCLTQCSSRQPLDRCWRDHLHHLWHL